MSKILGVAGKKQSGKNTTANIIHGLVLMEKNMIMDFNIDQYGKLFIKTKDKFGQEGWGEFDICRRDKEFVEYAEYNLWPFVKLYSFADTLKWLCVDIFNVPDECVWGTNEQKNQVQEHLLWENMPGVITHKMVSSFMVGINPPIKTANDYIEYDKDFTDVFKFIIHEPGPMTAREFMQFFGTEIMRKIYSNVWIDNTMKRIKKESSELAIVADVRFPNEILSINNNGGSVIKLTREAFKDGHSSELALDDFDKSHFKTIIDNGLTNYTIEDLIKDIKSVYQSI